jgi:glycosyltransferase involved in cell wall biosynthesis
MTQTTHAPLRPLPGLLSVVIPFYNEEETIPHLRERLTQFFRTLPCPVELVLVDDGSRDRTVAALQDWAAEDPNVVVIALSRNFGHQSASTAGLDHVHGDAAVLMDADLQDPPELILDMLREYQAGYDVVYAQREARLGETRMKKLTAWLFYRLMRWSGCDLPPDTGDFRLISSSCLQALQGMRETHRFLRGMVAWIGFPQTAVRFVRPPRVAGETKYNFAKMLRFAWTAAMSFSAMPLRIVFGMGVAAGFAAMGIGVYAVGALLLHYYVIPGWTSILFTLCLIGSSILIGLGMIGEYIAKIYEEVKSRPLYFVDSFRSRNVKLHEARAVAAAYSGARRA